MLINVVEPSSDGKGGNCFKIFFGEAYLEYVREIPEIEHVMELDSSGQEAAAYPGVEIEGALDHHGGYLHHTLNCGDALEMLVQNWAVDCSQSFLGGEADGEHAEVSLKQKLHWKLNFCSIEVSIWKKKWNENQKK